MVSMTKFANDEQAEEFLKLTQEVRQFILASDPDDFDNLKEIGMFLTEWLQKMPRDIRKRLGIRAYLG
jgi:hypothetical protein